MEVCHCLFVSVIVADKIDFSVFLQYKIVADVIDPVRKTEACVENILAPAPLVKTSGHRDRRARFIAVILRGHIIFLEGDKCIVKLIQRLRNFQSEIVEPCLVDHGELWN